MTFVMRGLVGLAGFLVNKKKARALMSCAPRYAAQSLVTLSVA